jgi:hypothetical protein
MPTYPTSPRSAFLTWCDAHTEVFADNAAAIGLSPGAAAAFAAALDAANASVTSQAVAKDAAKVATNELATNMETLSSVLQVAIASSVLPAVSRVSARFNRESGWPGSNCRAHWNSDAAEYRSQRFK